MKDLLYLGDKNFLLSAFSDGLIIQGYYVGECKQIRDKKLRKKLKYAVHFSMLRSNKNFQEIVTKI